MAHQEPKLDWEEESITEKLLRKAKTSPFLVIGLVGLTAACGIGAYKFKNRGTMSTSVFLMQLRVAAQGTVVACLTAGMVYHMVDDYLLSPSDSNNDTIKKN